MIAADLTCVDTDVYAAFQRGVGVCFGGAYLLL
jgi:hypothetical protein